VVRVGSKPVGPQFQHWFGAACFGGVGAKKVVDSAVGGRKMFSGRPVREIRKGEKSGPAEDEEFFDGEV